MLDVKVHRGGNQIGGSIIEVHTDKTKIILDVGTELEEEYPPTVPDIPGLFQGEPGYDAVIISHFHQDHTGLVPYVLPGIPVYMASKMYALYKRMYEYRSDRKAIQPVMFDENGARKDGSYRFQIGDITITPYLCDHSAFDSYMYLLENSGESVLYTGDFRSNGRKSFDALIHRLPRVDKLIIEGTTLSRENPQGSVTEEDLQDEMKQIMSETEGGVFLLAASSNIDRIVTAYKASKQTGRTFLTDTYLSSLLELAGGGIPNPNTAKDMRAFQIGAGDDVHEELMHYRNRIGRSQIKDIPFTMCIRASRTMERYLDKMDVAFFKCTLIYSMWNGYKSKDSMKRFLDYVADRGMNIVTLHTSGHADENAIRKLIDKTEPKEIIPVHTTMPEKLRKLKK